MAESTAYVAAIERRRETEDFYVDKVAPAIIRFDIDDWIQSATLREAEDFISARSGVIASTASKEPSDSSQHTRFAPRLGFGLGFRLTDRVVARSLACLLAADS